jgi:hypothetical protein
MFPFAGDLRCARRFDLTLTPVPSMQPLHDDFPTGDSPCVPGELDGFELAVEPFWVSKTLAARTQ